MFDFFFGEKESALERGILERGESAAKVELAQVSLSGLGLIEFSTCENSFPHFRPILENMQNDWTRQEPVPKPTTNDNARGRSKDGNPARADLSRFIADQHCSSAAYRQQK